MTQGSGAALLPCTLKCWWGGSVLPALCLSFGSCQSVWNWLAGLSHHPSSWEKHPGPVGSPLALALMEWPSTALWHPDLADGRCQDRVGRGWRPVTKKWLDATGVGWGHSAPSKTRWPGAQQHLAWCECLVRSWHGPGLL